NSNASSRSRTLSKSSSGWLKLPLRSRRLALRRAFRDGALRSRLANGFDGGAEDRVHRFGRIEHRRHILIEIDRRCDGHARAAIRLHVLEKLRTVFGPKILVEWFRGTFLPHRVCVRSV